MIQLLLLFLIVIFLSGLCSMSEAAVLSIPMIRIRILLEQKKVHAKKLYYLKENIVRQWKASEKNLLSQKWELRLSRRFLRK